MPEPDDSASQRIAALEETIARLTQELTEVRLSLQRASVQQALLDERLLAVERNRLFRWWDKVYRTAAGLYARTGAGDRYGGVSDLRTPGDYERWVNHEQHELEAADHRGTAASWRLQPLITVWLSGSEGARESMLSVVSQCYAKWELCVPASLKGLVEDSRVRVVAGAEPAGEFVMVLESGDRLSPHALHFYAQALQDDAVSMVYADEECGGAPLFKPGWSPELQASTTAYPGRGVLKRRGGAARVRHIPRVLYYRAAAAPVVAVARQYQAPADARMSIVICSRQVRQVRECLAALRKTAAVSHEVLVVHHLETGDGEEMRRCVEGFGGTWIPYRGPFDFARMNNLAAGKATAECLLFLNDDVIVQERGWDSAIAATLARAEIGVVGAILEYPDGTLQHAGVVVGMGDGAGHCGRFQKSSELWPWLRMTRDVTAVTGAMLGVRTAVFQQMRGFDEAFPVNYNDVDLCLRVRRAGSGVVCLDVGKVVHRESQTRVGGTRHEERECLYRRWAEVLGRGDEFYSGNLAASERIGLRVGMGPLAGLRG